MAGTGHQQCAVRAACSADSRENATGGAVDQEHRLGGREDSAGVLLSLRDDTIWAV